MKVLEVKLIRSTTEEEEIAIETGGADELSGISATDGTIETGGTSVLGDVITGGVSEAALLKRFPTLSCGRITLVETVPSELTVM